MDDSNRNLARISYVDLSEKPDGILQDDILTTIKSI